MARITEWTIRELICYPEEAGQTDVVTIVKWYGYVRYDDAETGVGHKAERQGRVDVTYQVGDPFTPYDQLTESQVWDWVDAVIDRPALEAEMNAEVDGMITPSTTELPLPW
jgi:hypothetical protein